MIFTDGEGGLEGEMTGQHTGLREWQEAEKGGGKGELPKRRVITLVGQRNGATFHQTC